MHFSLVTETYLKRSERCMDMWKMKLHGIDNIIVLQIYQQL